MKGHRMNEIREYIQKVMNTVGNNDNSLRKSKEVYEILGYIDSMIKIYQATKAEAAEVPELKVGDTWLVKIGERYELLEFTIGQIKEKTISNQFTTYRFSHLQSLNESWYKISDIEWVERIEE